MPERPQTARNTLLLELATVAAFCGFLFFYGLGNFGLIGADEPRYAQIAREMLERRDFITPVLHGRPWLEKPVLYYWLAAASYAVFGVSDWAARLPCTVLASALVFAVYFFLRRFRPGTQLNGALMTAASAGLAGFSRGASTDMPLAAFFVGGMLSWFAWHQTARRRWLLLFYLCIGIGTLAKGPVAPVLAALVIGLYALLRRDLGLIWRTLWLPGILAFLAAALPWYAAVQLRTPEFFHEFVIRHNLARYALNIYAHKYPHWFYVPTLLLGVMPWTTFAIAALVDAVKRWRRPVAPEGALPAFLAAWMVVIFAFFSISESKLPGYILPVFPACTMLLAVWLQPREQGRAPAWMTAVHALLLGTLTTAVLLTPYLFLQRLQPIPPAALKIGIVVGVVLAAAVFLTIHLRGLAMLRFATLAAAVLLFAYILRVDAISIDRMVSARPVARELQQLGAGQEPIAVYKTNRQVEYGLAFYRNQPIDRYERAEVPQVDHLVITRTGLQEELAQKVGGRRLSRLGGFPPQKLEYFWVSPPPRHEPAAAHRH